MDRGSGRSLCGLERYRRGSDQNYLDYYFMSSVSSYNMLDNAEALEIVALKASFLI